MKWFSFKSRKVAARRRRTNSSTPRIEQCEERLLMAVVTWNDAPPGFNVTIENKSLVFQGSDKSDRVTVKDVANFKPPGVDLPVSDYIEIGHRGDRLRTGWVKQDTNLSFRFHGNGGNDSFQYIKTSTDRDGRYPRQIVAFGGPDNDTLYGYSKNDSLYGGTENDDLWGLLGSDVLEGGAGNDRLWGDGWTNTNATGTTDTDYLVGGDGADQLYGWQGGDFLNGGDRWNFKDGDVDTLYGGEHADIFLIELFSEPNKKEATDFSTLPSGQGPDSYANPLDRNGQGFANIFDPNGGNLLSNPYKWAQENANDLMTKHPNTYFIFAHGDGSFIYGGAGGAGKQYTPQLLYDALKNDPTFQKATEVWIWACKSGQSVNGNKSFAEQFLVLSKKTAVLGANGYFDPSQPDGKNVLDKLPGQGGKPADPQWKRYSTP